MCRLSWFLDPGGWSKTAVVRLYFIFPGICTLSLVLGPDNAACQLQASTWETVIKSNQRVFGYSYDIYTTIAPMGMSYQACHYCSLRSSQL
ncbi:hypothetical protein STEG23_038097, partial [Scotinomys teguina]